MTRWFSAASPLNAVARVWFAQTVAWLHPKRVLELDCRTRKGWRNGRETAVQQYKLINMINWLSFCHCQLFNGTKRCLNRACNLYCICWCGEAEPRRAGARLEEWESALCASWSGSVSHRQTPSPRLQLEAAGNHWGQPSDCRYFPLWCAITAVVEGRTSPIYRFAGEAGASGGGASQWRSGASHWSEWFLSWGLGNCLEADTRQRPRGFDTSWSTRTRRFVRQKYVALLVNSRRSANHGRPGSCWPRFDLGKFPFSWTTPTDPEAHDEGLLSWVHPCCRYPAKLDQAQSQGICMVCTLVVSQNVSLMEDVHPKEWKKMKWVAAFMVPKST